MERVGLPKEPQRSALQHPGNPAGYHCQVSSTLSEERPSQFVVALPCSDLKLSFSTER